MSESTQFAEKRHILICLDGVGISAIEEMQAQGYLTMFHRPSHMLSTFPSLTNAAISSILAPSGAERPLGYEDTYFDVNANKMRGGIVDRLRKDKFIKATYRRLFDYHPSAIKSGLAYIGAPYSIYLESISDLSRLRQKSKRTKQQVFLGYIGATDTLAHLGGEKMLYKFLRRLDETVQSLLHDSKTPVVITVFSDHGNHFRSYQRAGLRDPFEKAGFKLETRIADERSVVFPQFGLVGSAVLFTREANKTHLASVAAAVEGVDFAAYENDGKVHIISEHAEATIEKRDQCYRYAPVKGDLFGFKNSLSRIEITDGFCTDTAWFDATKDGPRPDVIRRIFEGTTQTVVNRGSVVINFKDGYYTGSSFLDALSTLRATHGNIGRGQSYGFAMSTSIKLPSHLRSNDLWKLLGSPKLTRSTLG